MFKATERVARMLGIDAVSLALEKCRESPDDRTCAEDLAAAVVGAATVHWPRVERQAAREVLVACSSWSDKVRYVERISRREDAARLAERPDLATWLEERRAEQRRVTLEETLSEEPAEVVQAYGTRLESAHRALEELIQEDSLAGVLLYWERLQVCWDAASGAPGDWGALGRVWGLLAAPDHQHQDIVQQLRDVLPGWAGPGRIRMVGGTIEVAVAGVAVALAFSAPSTWYAVATAAIWLWASGRLAKTLWAENHRRLSVVVASAALLVPLLLLRCGLAS